MRYAIISVVALFACGAPTDNKTPMEAPTSVNELRIVHPAVVRVTVKPAKASTDVANTVQYVATARDGQGRILRAAAWKWTSSDTAVAVVSVNGLVTGRTVGNGIITATAYPPWRR